MSRFVAVIMAGGVGQRFWPLSTAECPKQFLDLERSGRSLLQATFDRLLPVTEGADDVFVVTTSRYADLVVRQLPQLRPDNLLVEPIGRDTAPAVALAALVVRRRLGNPIMGLFPADHRIERVARFHQTLRRAIAATDRLRGIVTLGMQADRPATGYGYIEQGEAVDAVHRVARFVEKPDRSTAERYLRTGRYRWNGGIFLWHADTILGELERHAAQILWPLSHAFAAGHLGEVYPALPKLSIDYAVLEKTDRAYVLAADFGWDDVGDWNALQRLPSFEDTGENTVVGNHVCFEATDNLVYGDDERDLIVMLGVRDLVVVKRGNAVLVVHKERVQDIKRVLADDRIVART